MTDEVKSRIDYYVSKLGGWPHVTNLAADFSTTKEQAKTWLDEYRSMIKRPIMAPSPANPVTPEVTRITKQQFETISKKPDNSTANNAKPSNHVQHVGGFVVLRVISGLVALACIIRGLIVIVEINTVIGWQGYLNAIIFQGGSAILPVVGLMYLAMVKDFLSKETLFGVFLFIGGLGSMVYEIYASSQAFHQTNIKQEISVQKDLSDTGDSILQSIEDNIKSENENMGRITSNLSIRRSELSLLTPEMPGYRTAVGRVSTNLSDQTKSQDTLNGLNKQKTDRLIELEKKNNKQSSVINLVQNNDFIQLLITLIPSIMMVIFTPIFVSIALFGIGGKDGKND